MTKLTGRQTKLIIVFAVGLTALIVDRLFLRPEGPVSQAAADESDSIAVVATTDNLPVLEAKPAGPEITHRLDTVGAGESPDFDKMRNPFSPPRSWMRADPVVVPKTDSACEAFARKHKLTAVADKGLDSYVLVDDQLLVPGEVIDGFRLVAIGRRIAVFERNGRQVTLKLADDL